MKSITKLLVVILLVFSSFIALQSIKPSQLDLQLVDKLIHLIEILVWPFTLVFSIKLFEQEIRNFLSRLKSLSGPGGVTAEAYEEQQKVEENKRVEALASELEKSKNLEKTLVGALEETNRSRKEYELLLHFERTYRLIFGSQLGILLRLREKLNEGLNLSVVVMMYRASGWYERGYNIDGYINFLTNSGLVEFDGVNNKYKITSLGIVFLNYLEKENIPLNKPS